MRLGLLYALLRTEEKMLLKAAEDRSVTVEKLNAAQMSYELDRCEQLPPVDVVLERCVSHSRALYALRFFKSYGIPCVNTFEVAEIAGDKALTSLAFADHKVPTPRTIVAFSPEQALAALDTIGYPAVMKPVTGSWARLLAKVENVQQAESIIEHKSVLGHYLHSIFYIQEYVDKPGRDLRTFVVGDECIAGITRASEHWITNTARGGRAEALKVTDEIADLSVRAANAVGGGVIAADLMERPDGSLTCHEVNYTMEFRNSVGPTGVDIPGRIIEYAIAQARR